MDNDEDGAVEEAMFNNYNGDGIGAVCYNFEIVPQRPLVDQFDATLEEVLHTISSIGYANVYPEWNEEENSNSLLTQAMDVARGGHFVNIPNPYPAAAWYHYDDFTCEYNCMATEYFYWGLTSMLGIQDYGDRCEQIDNEWEPCTAAQFEATDQMLFDLFSDPQYHFPTVAPDGNYCPIADGVTNISLNSINIFPNPTSETLTIKLANKINNIKYTISDLLGKELLAGTLQDDQETIDLSNFTEGVYILKVDGITAKKFSFMKN